MSTHPQAVVLMGVSGCGKTSIGQELSKKLDWPFFDGDDFHPKTNIEKMAAGTPLDCSLYRSRTGWFTHTTGVG